MTIYSKLIRLSLSAFLLAVSVIAMSSLLSTVPLATAEDAQCEPDASDCIEIPESLYEPKEVCEDTGVFGESNKEECDCKDQNLNSGNCEIVGVLEGGLNILTGVAALSIVGGIMYGGYTYMTARDNPGQIQAARQRILWAVVALFILLFFWGGLQWLIPGGVL